MPRWKWGFGLTAALFGFVPACVTSGEGAKIWSEIKALQAQGSEIQRSLTDQKTKLVELIRSADQRVADLNKKIEQAESVLRRSNVDFFQQLQTVQNELSKASGRVETIERNGEVQKRDFDAFREEVNRRITKLQAAAVQAAAPPPPAPLDPAAAYDAAARELQAGRFDKAVDAYLQIIQQFPKHARMEDIQFGLAEAYYGKRDYKAALAEYSRFYQDFAESGRAPEALFRLAQCYEADGKYDTAQVPLKVILKKFKKSSFAKEAKKLLKQLKKKQ
jgi:TolA-binding protein